MILSNHILCGDSMERLKDLPDSSVDLIVTDPPYGYSFMGKDWDRAVPSVAIWVECLRVLKPGAFAFIMSAPRLDVQSEMARRIQEAGFNIAFTPLYWTYSTGFPKAQNMSKAVDKRLGAEREVVGVNPVTAGYIRHGRTDEEIFNGTDVNRTPNILTAPATPEAKALDGSYAGFQPKPAVEVIMVAMKPLSEKTYIDQALANGKGVTWLDDCAIPTNEAVSNHSRGAEAAISKGKYGDSVAQETHQTERQKKGGRFPANLLVSDDVLDDGLPHDKGGSISGYDGPKTNEVYGKFAKTNDWAAYGDSGGYSRYFSLDKWAENLPFLIVPKASKKEKNEGCDGIKGNIHPTVKPLTLMAYLITLGSRGGDVVLDPFAGSGTTCVAAKELGRQFIGVELNPEYAEIAKARIEAAGAMA